MPCIDYKAVTGQLLSLHASARHKCCPDHHAPAHGAGVVKRQAPEHNPHDRGSLQLLRGLAAIYWHLQVCQGIPAAQHRHCRHVALHQCCRWAAASSINLCQCQQNSQPSRHDSLCALHVGMGSTRTEQLSIPVRDWTLAALVFAPFQDLLQTCDCALVLLLHLLTLLRRALLSSGSG